MPHNAIDRSVNDLRSVARWALRTADDLERLSKEFPMGREADAINKLQGQVSDLKAQLATAQASGKDAADIAAENGVLGDPAAGPASNEPGVSPA